MDQNHQYQQLANDIMEMWQKHLSGMMGDKRYLQMMMDMMEYAQRMQTNDAAGSATPNSTARYSSNAADADDGLLAELAFRLAMCEKRLATVEKQLAETKKPAGKPRKSTAKRKPAGKPRKSTAKRKPATKRAPAGSKTTRK